MPPKLFGWEFPWNRKSSRPGADSVQPTGTALSPVPADDKDGALNVQYGAGGGYYGYYLDLDGTVVDDFQLINRYREMQVVAEVDEAIDQIINEMVIQDDQRMPVSLNLDYVDDSVLDEKIKIRVQAEFDSLLKQLHFHKDAYSVVRQWYVDGRIYYYMIVDEEAPEDGILDLRIIDPRCIRKIREVTRKRHEETGLDIVEVQREYYAYNPMGFIAPSLAGGAGQGQTASQMQYNSIKLTMDSVAYCTSGLYDHNRRTVLSWLHKAIKPLNLMRMIEDSCVIYRVARAPERRVFYIDVGNLPKGKAEQYLQDIMNRYRNKLVYDVSSGEIRDDRKFMSIMEDFWLPRREGGKGTEITTLPAGQNLSEMEDVDYFRRKLYRALNVPPSRIDQASGFNLGKSSEISRDELKFSKFIHRLQTQFNSLFDQLLEKQLRLKQVLTEQEWFRVKDNLRYDWQTDSFFEELKNQEMWTNRLLLLSQMDGFTNKYFSSKWIQREILKFTDDEMASIREEFDDAEDTGFGDEGDENFEDGEDAGEDAPFGKKDPDSPVPGNMDDDADEILVSTKDTDDDGEKDEFGVKLKSKKKDESGDENKDEDADEKKPNSKKKSPFTKR